MYGCCAALAALVWVAGVSAQAPSRGGARGARGAAAAPAAQVHGNMNQLMRGVLFPASNLVFAAQGDDPAKIDTGGRDAATATDPLRSVYGGWTAVENAGITLAESANLLTLPGRVCSNGKPAPVGNADWVKWSQELRAVGMAAYKAAQAKNQDQILDVSDRLSTACANCHEKYREKPNAADRCTP